MIQNYPTPFTEKTSISFSIRKEGNVKISIYNIAGKLIKIILQERKQSGEHIVDFFTKGLQNGLYFCEIVTPDYKKTTKIILAN